MLIRVTLPVGDDAARACLAALVSQHDEDFAGLSRLVGRPAGYLRRYVKEGRPKRLGEQEQRTLARYFQIPAQRLGAPSGE